MDEHLVAVDCDGDGARGQRDRVAVDDGAKVARLPRGDGNKLRIDIDPRAQDLPDDGRQITANTGIRNVTVSELAAPIFSFSRKNST